jgi:hypothetical protein
LGNLGCHDFDQLIAWHLNEISIPVEPGRSVGPGYHLLISEILENGSVLRFEVSDPVSKLHEPLEVLEWVLPSFNLATVKKLCRQLVLLGKTFSRIDACERRNPRSRNAR